MKKPSIFWTHVIGAALVAMSSTAVAQNAKVGFVDVGRLLEDSPQAVAARQKLQNEFAPRNEELEKLHKEVSDLAQKLANESDVMSEEQRLEQEREVQRRRRDFERKRDEVREDLAIRRNEELGKLQDEVNTVVAAIASEEGFDLILTQAVSLYASKRIDITDRVLQKMNNP